MKTEIIEYLDALNIHLNAIETVTIAIIGLIDAEERDFEVVASTLKHHTEKAREIQKKIAEWYRKTKK